MNKNCLTFIFLVLFLVNGSHAQEVWSLRKCVDHAMKHNLNLKQSMISIQNASLDEKLAKSSRYPNLNFNTNLGLNLGRTIDPVTNDFDNQNITYNSMTLSAGVLLYNGGRINNTIKQSKSNAEAAEYDAKQVSNDIALSVSLAYLNVLFAEERVSNAISRKALSQAQLEQTEKLIKAGSLPANDRLDLEAQLALDDQNLINTQNNVDIQYLNLKQILQLDPAFDLQVEKPNIEVPVEDPDNFSLEEVVNAAYENQPFIQAGVQRLKSAQLGEQIAKSGFYPSLSLFGDLSSNYSDVAKKINGFQTVPVQTNIEFNGTPATITTFQDLPLLEDNPYFDQLNENFGQSLGLSLRVPIYNNFQNKAAVQRAKLGTLNQEISNKLNEQNLKTNVQQAISDARGAKRSYEAAQKTVASLKASYENMERKFAIGAANTFEITTTKNRWDQAEVDLIVAKYDYVFKLKVVDYYLGKEISLD